MAIARDHEVLVSLRPQLVEWLQEQAHKRDEWPVLLHKALARTVGLPEQYWSPRPVGRPPATEAPPAKPVKRANGSAKGGRHVGR